MIHATLATYPPRVENLRTVIAALSPQVDRLRIILNEFREVPRICNEFNNVEPIIPEYDTKDTGKFLFSPEPDDWLFTVDDDIFYPSDYVVRSIAALESTGVKNAIGGYHGSIYTRHRYLNYRFLRKILRRNPNFIVGHRNIFGFSFELQEAMYVNQLGTGVALMRGRDVPPFNTVSHGQRFIDVAAARWWFETGHPLICLPRPAEWITEREPTGETIIGSFTSHNPAHVADEIYGFAYRNPLVGKTLPASSISSIHGGARTMV